MWCLLMSMRLTPHRLFAANPTGVDWVCGDLHGEFKALQAALSDAGFNKVVDRLFLLGDTIDRGPESRALLEWVLTTDWVHSVMGNHELMFIAGAEDSRSRYKHWGMGGDWAATLDEVSYTSLATRCRYQFPLTITLGCANGQLGLVHAQSPFDDWRTVQDSPFSERFAIECTWPWNRAQGADHSISGISAVVSGHIGTDEMVQKGNQLWIDTLAKTGRVPLMPAHHVLDLVAIVPRNG